jgi:hypothetical protein
MVGIYGVSTKRKFSGKIYQYYSGYFRKVDALQSKALLNVKGFNARIVKTKNSVDKPYVVYSREKKT